MASHSISLERLLTGYCQRRGMRFLVEGGEEPAARILSADCFMPVLVVQAEASAYGLLQARRRFVEARQPRQQVPGHQPRPEIPAFPLGSQLRDDEHAMFGLYAVLPDVTPDGEGSIRCTMFLHALHRVFGWQAGTEIECAGLFHQYAGSGLRELASQIAIPQESASWQRSSN